jgi:hypothetical protein
LQSSSMMLRWCSGRHPIIVSQNLQDWLAEFVPSAYAPCSTSLNLMGMIMFWLPKRKGITRWTWRPFLLSRTLPESKTLKI